MIKEISKFEPLMRTAKKKKKLLKLHFRQNVWQ